MSLGLIRPSLAEMVYERLVEGIMTGELAGGAPLNVGELSETLKVSASPVRDALQRLSAEGLVTVSGSRRAAVVTFSRRDVEEIFGLREILECGAIRLAAGRMDEATVRSLREAESACAGVPDTEKKRRLELDARFHLAVGEASGNAHLREEIVRCNRRVRVMQLVKLDPGTLTQADPEHRSVVEALAGGDADAAEAALRTHLRNALELVLRGV